MFESPFSRCFTCLTGLCVLLASAAASRGQEIGFERIQLSDQFYSEGGTHGDYNGDARGDVAVGPWIYYGPTFHQKSRFYEGEAIDPAGYSENFLMYTDDVNADGRPDILVLGFPGKESWWYENPGPDAAAKQLWQRHTILDVVDNESPLIADIDGDGVKDLICSSKGHYGYATHAGQAPTEMWKFIKVSPDNGYQRFTHGLGIGDVNNDNHIDLLEKDGWWQNPGQPTPDKPWQFHPFAFAGGGSQMYAVDLNGDTKNEVVTGLVAHGFGLVYYRALNPEATQFERVEIMTDSPETSPVGLAVSQLHALEIADINRDGVPDMVTGKRWWAHANKDAGNSQPATLLWLETQRAAGRVRFVPHVIDNSSGVGTQVTVGDVNGDGLLDIVAGIKRGAYLFLQRPATLPPQQSLVPALAEADAYGQRPATESAPLNDDPSAFMPALAGRTLNFGFEAGNFNDWEIRGPMAAKALVAPPSGAPPTAGKFMVDTGSQNAGAIGELISRPFQLTHRKLSFLLGGGSNPEARVELVAEQSGQVLAAANADGSDGLQRKTWELPESAVGSLVRLRVVDHAAEVALQVDDFRLTN